ncbi:phosphotransferase [Nocardia mexicana]|uniref:Phosphotransferase family enzyme n=1 Tax=Nocardia mexicana TaxID=279262 RepID=A0A370GI28_9NOCA|nr:phosphotransferase [Nocardia mexicana]RDI43468.1 phosphotransferase family enzyme [Nocardia mexicana]
MFTNLADMANKRGLTSRHAQAVGRAVARLHSESAAGEPNDQGVPRCVPVDLVLGLDAERWASASRAELEVWSLLHGDRPLCRSLLEFAAGERQLEPVPLHGDLRLENIHLTGEGDVVTELHSSGSGDPARDLGRFLGDIVYWALLSIIKDVDGTFSMDVDFDDRDIIERGFLQLQDRSEVMVEFWSSYIDNLTLPAARLDLHGWTNGVAVRTVSWAGWHMFERMLAENTYRNRLLSIYRCIAGISRGLLLSPRDYRDTLGLVQL